MSNDPREAGNGKRKIRRSHIVLAIIIVCVLVLLLRWCCTGRTPQGSTKVLRGWQLPATLKTLCTVAPSIGNEHLRLPNTPTSLKTHVYTHGFGRKPVCRYSTTQEPCLNRNCPCVWCDFALVIGLFAK